MMTAKLGTIFMFALAIFGFGAARAAEGGPDATVRDAYAVTIRQLAGTGKTEPPWRRPHRDRLMSQKLAALFARDDQYMEESGDIGHVDADPFISGQDGEVKNLKITVGSQTGDKATVFAGFRSLGTQMRVEFAMIRENGRWVIDDIIDTADGKPFRIRDLLSEPYECGSFMKKPCKK